MKDQYSIADLKDLVSKEVDLLCKDGWKLKGFFSDKNGIIVSYSLEKDDHTKLLCLYKETDVYGLQVFKSLATDSGKTDHTYEIYTGQQDGFLKLEKAVSLSPRTRENSSILSSDIDFPF